MNYDYYQEKGVARREGGNDIGVRTQKYFCLKSINLDVHFAFYQTKITPLYIAEKEIIRPKER